MRIESGFEPALQSKVRARYSPDIDVALQSSRARKRGGRVFLAAKSENRGSNLGQALKWRWIAGSRKQREVDHAAGSRQSCVWQRGLIGKSMESRKERAHAFGKKSDFEDGGGRKGFDEKWNGLADVMPKVGAWRFVKRREWRARTLPMNLRR